MSRRGLALSVAVGVGVVMAATPAWAGPPIRGAQARAEATPGGGGQLQAQMTVPAGSSGTDGNGQTGGDARNPEVADSDHTDGTVNELQGMMQHLWEPAPGRPPCSLGSGTGSAGEGVLYERIQYDAQNQVGFVTGHECLDPADTPDAPDPPPRPPSVQEITEAARAQIVSPSVGANPRSRGITGLPIRLWYDGPTEASVSTAIRGYTVTASMRPTQYCWDPGEPDSQPVCAPEPGSEHDWAQEYTYDTKGRYTLTVQAVWNGQWSFSGHGAAASGDLATVTTESSRSYEVNEIRGQLRDTR